MLIPDFADELFEDIFHGDDTVGAARFINDNGNMRFLRLPFFFSGRPTFVFSSSRDK